MIKVVITIESHYENQISEKDIERRKQLIPQEVYEVASTLYLCR